MMKQNSAKRVAKVKPTLTKRTVEALEPADKPWIAWDDKPVGFGCRIQPPAHSPSSSTIASSKAGARRPTSGSSSAAIAVSPPTRPGGALFGRRVLEFGSRRRNAVDGKRRVDDSTVVLAVDSLHG